MDVSLNMCGRDHCHEVAIVSSPSLSTRFASAHIINSSHLVDIVTHHTYSILEPPPHRLKHLVSSRTVDGDQLDIEELDTKLKDASSDALSYGKLTFKLPIIEQSAYH